MKWKGSFRGSDCSSFVLYHLLLEKKKLVIHNLCHSEFKICLDVLISELLKLNFFLSTDLWAEPEGKSWRPRPLALGDKALVPGI